MSKSKQQLAMSPVTLNLASQYITPCSSVLMITAVNRTAKGNSNSIGGAWSTTGILETSDFTFKAL